MDLGLEFDDEDFKSKKENENDKKKSYNAKVCNEFWYKTETPEPDNAGHVYKFRGDNLYHQKQYTEAIDSYKEGLDSLPLNSKTLRQDISECLARCYLHTEKYAEALDIAQQLVSDAKSPDQIMQTNLLLSQIQVEMKDTEGLEESLKLLLTMHPFTYSLWIKLGHCYQTRIEQNNHSSLEYLRMKRLSCVIRTRLLLINILRNSSSFFKAKLMKILNETERQQAEFDVPEHIISTASKYLKEDLCQNQEEEEEEEDDRDESQTGDIDQPVMIQKGDVSFDQRWFSWIQKEGLT
ncbi:uncharacterized protein C8orf76 homolog [Mytilus trossulus]|uniref:uncharacterized protein C8orf76 homolog n=1 Tax=Mytilus trossulus TaxID=6551 RepID=UPI0030054125